MEKKLTGEKRLEVPVGRTHVRLGYGQPADEALNGQSPPAGLPQVVLVLVEAAEPQGDGHALAPARTPARGLGPLQGVGVHVEVGRGVVLVVRLQKLRGLDEVGLTPGGARTTGAASGVAALRAQASARGGRAIGYSSTFGLSTLAFFCFRSLLQCDFFSEHA
jgi:hypothetical protein